MGKECEDGVDGGVWETVWYVTLPVLMLVIRQHLSLVCLIHSFGVHLSHIQKAHCLQHLQQQHEQLITISITTVINTTILQVVDNNLKCSELCCSCLIKSWISLIFTLAIFKSSIEVKYW